LPLTEIEMDTNHEEMTAAEHVERAQNQGQTVAEYCRQMGLSVHPLYSARRQLKEKGQLSGTRKRRPLSKRLREFIPVSVTDARPAVVCRVRHAAGWVIECATWPDPSWVKLLTGEQT
jgi:hypothetical protein